MHEKVWVCYRGSDHTTHRRLCESSILGITKINSSYDPFETQTEANRTEIVISKQRTEIMHSVGVYTSVLWPLGKCNVTPKKTHSTPLGAKILEQMMNVIPLKHTSEGMWFTNLLITSLAKWSDISHMEKSLTLIFLISCLTTFINWTTLCSGQWKNTFISHGRVPRCKNVKYWGKIEINLTIMRKISTY